ncbi:MAG: GFA family protein [Dokdonella sp.]
MNAAPIVHSGGCHCRRVRFEVDAPAVIEALDCNCSICRMSGFLHLIVPATRFRLLEGAQQLREYTFNTGSAKHRFCTHCGIKSFYIPRSHPHGIDVNVRCLDAATIARIDIVAFDDARRAESEAAIAHLSSRA